MVEQFDAVVALGGFFTPDGKHLNSDTLARVDYASQLVLSGFSKHLIVTGAYPAEMDPKLRPQLPQAYLMRQRALELGVHDFHIHSEAMSFDTVGNAIFAKQITERNSWNNLLVVTSPYHLRRSLSSFRHVMGPDYSVEGVATEFRASTLVRARENIGRLVLRAVVSYTEQGDEEGILKYVSRIIPGYDPHLTKREAITNLVKDLGSSF